MYVVKVEAIVPPRANAGGELDRGSASLMSQAIGVTNGVTTGDMLLSQL